MLDENKINTMLEKESSEEYTQNISSAVNHPTHYAAGRKYEPIDVIEDWDLGFSLGNVVKYISRAGRKNDTLEDLKKAQFYLNYAIVKLEDKLIKG